ncbi:ROK family protein [Cohnella lubricantis]|uniref:ROK family protein n=1 Tax=Cohnella lubricantis TaxID=2163172 RepID=A0A841T3B6_9BACL|nr:ROK family protein [Cohnella lubricantis]MBB6676083.1 ROK family protein [Cohnella lubricantis]MBP2118038.1 putative NBD/HSP70 family sugar kinase [Cohnella lubricantis]
MIDQRSHRLPSPKRMVYFDIAERGTVSKAELLGRFSLSGTSMTRLLEEMTAEGLILASGFGPSSGGRRPILYETNPAFGYFCGLEISRFHSALGLFDMRMNPLSFVRWRMDEKMTPQALADRVAGAVQAALREQGIKQEQVLGFGIGSVGPLDRESGIILQPLHFPAPGWANVPICRLIEERTGFAAQLDNGANTALIGEHWSMRSANPQHMLYVHTGVGLRSAMMSYGQIIYGSVDMEGAIGQMIVQSDGPQLYDGSNFGALEAYVSVQALEKRAQTHAIMGASPLTELFGVQPEQIRYDLLLEALRQEHPYAMELFQQGASFFGIGLANMINMLHPEIVIVGGTLIQSHEMFLRTAIDIARKNTYYHPQYQPVFSEGELKEDAVATGAALMMWKQLELR